ncbi:MAG: exonuclease SbcCD subunit D C-terminal domain-containing protein [Oleiphilaceae bacterium]|nr:exonuclease SbcCD subunit D C-terminal domain-containing protein [Oleiphilaceae bacterium]
MNIIHTSDWHIGKTLYGRRRYEEFDAFLHWLADAIERESADVLLVAGDVFDISAPSNRAQELYYRFLCQVAASRCRHVVVIAGNHDSPTFLNASRQLLKALNVYVVGAACDNLEDEVLVLASDAGEPELIVCAVPYLRDRDIRVAEAGESIDDKERKLLEGIRSHYEKVAALAVQKREALNTAVPIVAMGHLFTAGGKTIEGDGVRELYVGSLAHVTGGIFPDSLDYVALGHLHVPQKVNGSAIVRYSGSPIPMGFGEARQQKSLCLVSFRHADTENGGFTAEVNLLDIPRFQALERIKGDWADIETRLRELVDAGSSAWLEVVYEGEEIISDLRDRLDQQREGSALEILRVKDSRIINRVLERMDDEETLDDLRVEDVFQRCLTAHAVPEDQRPELLSAYKETLIALYERDAKAD